MELFEGCGLVIHYELDARLQRIGRYTVEHPFGTLKAWMGATHFLMKTQPRVITNKKNPAKAGFSS